MKYRKLGHTDIDVSLICLGTMTWGQQNSQAEAFAQMDYALDQGVNFWDAAEMYPVPTKAETSGETERIIGNWLAKNGRRDDIVLASKVSGRSDRIWIRDGQETRLNRTQIEQAIDGSLNRLKTDHLDLYQLHWPDRRLGLWGEGNGSYLHKTEEGAVPIQKSMEVMADLVKSGKVRHVGISNETAWGVSQFLTASTDAGLPRIVSIQNSYNLLNRVFEGDLSEFSYRENLGLLAYSPLAMGTLTGKYLEGSVPPKSRLDLFPNFLTRFQTPHAVRATQQYVDLAREYSLSPTELALGFINSRPFVTANIIGATTILQLKQNIATAEVEISAELEAAINQIHIQCKNPAAS